jgi:predicted RNase H-like nuclease/ppGpp synthetase/RelA/SpoT-type nucleotidyltranferase
MYFVGVDLPWGEKNQTGIAVAGIDGRLVHVGVARSDEDILTTLKPYVTDDCLVAIDAPLVASTSGTRSAEVALNRDFAPFQAGAKSANDERPEFKHPRGARLAAALDLDVDPTSASHRRAIEVYPNPATVVLFDLAKTIKYKRGRFEDRQPALLELMTHVEDLDRASPRLRVNRNIAWVELRKRVEAATRPSQLDHDEDPVDAVICAYVAMYSYSRPDDVTIYGDAESGFILTPTLSGARPTPERHAPSPRAAIAEYAARRPALLEACDRYQRLVTELLDDAGINYLSVTARTKTVESFAGKATRTKGDEPLFTDPLSEITDQIGLRVITYLRDDVATVATLLGEELRLLEDRDWGAETAREGRWGYASRHLLVGIEGEQQPASIQIRTVLQHAWAEFEHDIRYKGSIPAAHVRDLDRRFTLAAGLLELADGEFSAIRERLRATTIEDEVDAETTSDPRIATPVLATYLGHRYADAGWSRTDHYGWISGLLLELGITTLDELTALLDGVDEDAVNRAMDYRYPAGAVRRLDDALLAHYGDRYLTLHGNAHRKDLLRTRFEKIDS